MALVWIPPLLQRLAGGEERVIVPGRTLRQVVEGLEAAYPGFRERLCSGDEVRPEIAVVLDGEVCSRGLLEPVEEESEVHFVPAVSGGRGARLSLSRQHP